MGNDSRCLTEEARASLKFRFVTEIPQALALALKGAGWAMPTGGRLARPRGVACIKRRGNEYLTGLKIRVREKGVRQSFFSRIGPSGGASYLLTQKHNRHETH